MFSKMANSMALRKMLSDVNNIDTCPISMADPENIGIAVGIALLACPGAEICASHGCRPLT